MNQTIQSQIDLNEIIDQNRHMGILKNSRCPRGVWMHRHFRARNRLKMKAFENRTFQTLS